MNHMNLAKQTIPIKQELPGVGGVLDARQSQEPVPVGSHHLHPLHLHTGHTDPELQGIVQGLEVSSPWFRAIFGVLFYGYDVSQGLRG